MIIRKRSNAGQRHFEGMNITIDVTRTLVSYSGPFNNGGIARALNTVSNPCFNP
jgi:hypothetical protein